MSAASLSLLKGGKKEDVGTELETEKAAESTEASPVEDGVEETSIDVDKMNDAELDALVQEYGIEVPGEWSGWQPGDKIAWLKEQFESDDAGEGDPAPEAIEEAAAPGIPEADDPGTPAPAAAEEAKPAGKKAKTTKAKAAEADPAVEPAAEEPAAKPAGKKATGKAVAVTTQAKTGDVMSKGEDLIHDLIHEIETLGEKEARKLIHTLAEDTEVTFFKLGGIFSVIQANGWFDPYGNLRDFVEKEHGINYRKATYWIAIYNAIVESKVSWSKVSSIGWTKLKEIAAVLTPENVDEWVKVAKANNTLSLIEAVKTYNQKNANKSLTSDATAASVTTKTFKVHEGQKEVINAALDKAKTNAGTTVDTVALELICSEFLATPTMIQRFKTLGIEKSLEALSEAFPNANINVELEEAE